MVKNLLVVINLSLLPFLVFAQAPENIASDRPGNAFSPLTVGKNMFQTQIGLDYGASNFDRREISNYNFLTSFFRYGLSNSFEISAQVDYRYDRIHKQVDENNHSTSLAYNLNGISNLGIGLRYNLLRSSGKGPDIGALLSVNFSNALGDYETKNETPTLIFVVQQPLPANFAVNVNLGASLIDPDREFLGIYVVNLGYGITNELSAFIESYGNFNEKQLIKNYDAGFAYLLNEDIQIDLYGGATDYQNVISYFASIGISIRTGKNSS